MTPSDDGQTPGANGHDDVVAKVRASLHGAATRTPIGADRLHEIRVSGGWRPSLGWVQVAASVVAIAAIAGIVAVLQGGHSSNNPSLQSGGDGKAIASSSPAVTSAVPSSVPVGGNVAPTPTPTASAGSCIPENYYVTAAPGQLTGMTYILPNTPAGYQPYGAWGTISRNNCLDSVTWYVEYDNKQFPSPIQLSVGRIAGEPGAAGPIPSPVAAIPLTIAGHPGWFFFKESYGSLIWRADGLSFQLSGPIVGGKPDALVAVAESLIAVPATDPRIVPPANCQVPPGSTCPSSTDSPTPTASDGSVSTEIPTANSSLTAWPTPSPTPTASPGG